MDINPPRRIFFNMWRWGRTHDRWKIWKNVVFFKRTEIWSAVYCFNNSAPWKNGHKCWINCFKMGKTFYVKWKEKKVHLYELLKNNTILLWKLLQYFCNKVKKNTCKQMNFNVYWITLWHTSDDTEGCGIQNELCAGFSEERCPVQETGRHGHCTEYRKKIFSKKENSSVYLYVARYVRMSVQSPLVVLKFNSAKRRGLFLWLTQKLESV